MVSESPLAEEVAVSPAHENHIPPLHPGPAPVMCVAQCTGLLSLPSGLPSRSGREQSSA